MVKLTKTQLQREKMRVNVKQSKQSTLDNPLEPKRVNTQMASKEQKRIVIDDISCTVKEDELIVKTSFTLYPSRAFFRR
jgi:hypothetical protein